MFHYDLNQSQTGGIHHLSSLSIKKRQKIFSEGNFVNLKCLRSRVNRE